MGVRLASAYTTTIVNAAPANGVETIIATTPPVNLTLDNALVLMMGYILGSVGAAATSINWKLRRGNALTSALINISGNDTQVAAALFGRTIIYFDSPGISADLPYSLTFTVNGGAAAAVITDVFLGVLIV